MDIMPALAVALQHPALHTDPHVLCRLAQLCRSCRAAVQQVDTRAVSVQVEVRKPPASQEALAALGSFAAWLPSNAGSVGSLAITAGHPRCSDLEVAAVEELIASCLHHAANPASPAAATAAAPGAAAKAVTEAAAEAASAVPNLVPLVLRTYTSDVLYSSRVLSALPAAALTHLDLTFPNKYTFGPAKDGLIHLQQLKQLRLSLACVLPDSRVSLRGQHLVGLAALAHLTRLELDGVQVDETSEWQLLPVQLRELNMHMSIYSNPQMLVDLSHLTVLQQLTITWQQELVHGAVLPSQLRVLELNAWGHHYGLIRSCGLTQLQQLQQVSINCTPADSEQLHLLAHLPQLQQVSLRYVCVHYAAGSALIWRQLPTLSALLLDGTERATGEQLRAILQGIAAVTSLTKLHLAVHYVTSVSVCESLMLLKGLKELRLHTGFSFPVSTSQPAWERDAMHLTRLTGLTSLVITELAVGDAVAAALKQRLTQLQKLHLKWWMPSATEPPDRQFVVHNIPDI